MRAQTSCSAARIHPNWLRSSLAALVTDRLRFSCYGRSRPRGCRYFSWEAPIRFQSSCSRAALAWRPIASWSPYVMRTPYAMGSSGSASLPTARWHSPWRISQGVHGDLTSRILRWLLWGFLGLRESRSGPDQGSLEAITHLRELSSFMW